MELSGTASVGAPREHVWRTIIDPRNVAACAPGIDAIDAIDDRHYQAKASLRLGFFSVGLTVDLERLDTEPMDRVVLAATGRAAGSEVNAKADVRLTGPTAGPTEVDWRATVELSGAVAGLGDNVIGPMASKMITDGIACLKARLEAEPA